MLTERQDIVRLKWHLKAPFLELYRYYCIGSRKTMPFV